MYCYFHLEAEGKRVKAVAKIRVDHIQFPDKVPVCQECLEDLNQTRSAERDQTPEERREYESGPR